MRRNVFFSFHYRPDNWRVSQVRNMGVIEGSSLVSDNDWESIARRGDLGIQRWIDSQLVGTSCTIVLVGESTANRKWVNYEIQESWNRKKGLFGIRIHNLKNQSGTQAPMGQNPFDYLSLNGQMLSRFVPLHNPPYSSSTHVYDSIKMNLERWIEEAIYQAQRRG